MFISKDLDVKPEPVSAETAPQAVPEAAPAVPEVASADTNFDEDLNFDLKKKKKKKAFKVCASFRFWRVII